MVKVSNDGTGQGLVEFWDWASGKGLMNKNTAGAMRAACNKVLEVEGGDLAAIDVRALDIEDLLRRFETLRKQQYSPQSLQTYKGRFRKALELYGSYLDNPSGWRPDIRQWGNGKGLAKRRARAAVPTGTATDGETQLIEYPFPLRPGVMATFFLPADLKQREVKRLTAYLDTLTEEEQLALSAGESEE